MLGNGGIPQVQEPGQFPDRALAVDQLADDQEPVPVGERLEKVTRPIGRLLHYFAIYFHTCVYTIVRIYSQELHNGRS